MIVLDASALVDIVLEQPAKGWALDQLDHEQVVAPAHQLAEVLSAIARHQRAGDVSQTTANDALAEAGELPQQLIQPTGDHLLRALAMQDRIRVLDALYIVVAQDHDAPLVTTDRRLARANPPIKVMSPPT